MRASSTCRQVFAQTRMSERVREHLGTSTHRRVLCEHTHMCVCIPTPLCVPVQGCVRASVPVCARKEAFIRRTLTVRTHTCVSVRTHIFARMYANYIFCRRIDSPTRTHALGACVHVCEQIDVGLRAQTFQNANAQVYAQACTSAHARKRLGAHIRTGARCVRIYTCARAHTRACKFCPHLRAGACADTRVRSGCVA